MRAQIVSAREAFGAEGALESGGVFLGARFGGVAAGEGLVLRVGEGEHVVALAGGGGGGRRCGVPAAVAR